MRLIDKINDLEQQIGSGMEARQSLGDLITILRDIRQILYTQDATITKLTKLFANPTEEKK